MSALFEKETLVFAASAAVDFSPAVSTPGKQCANYSRRVATVEILAINGLSSVTT